MPLYPWNDPFMSTWETWLRVEAERYIRNSDCYQDLYGDDPDDLTEDPRCLADSVDGFGTPY